MSVREIVLDGGSPWGFRMHGGVDTNQPLKISRDNAGTFDTLAPYLSKNIGFLAIDWLGHGKSDHNPRGIMYVIFDTIIALREMQELMGWSNLSFVSHSLGALSGYYYSSLFPDQIDFHISFDLLQRIVQEKKKSIQKLLHDFTVIDKLLSEKTEPKLYTYEEAVRFLYEISEKSITPECAKHLLERELISSKKDYRKFSFSQDERLAATGTENFSQKGLISMTKYVRTPLMDIRPLQSHYFTEEKFHSELKKILNETNKNFVQLSIPGTHYVHLTHPEHVADAVNGFILKHNSKNRLQTENIIEKIKINNI